MTDTFIPTRQVASPRRRMLAGAAALSSRVGHFVDTASRRATERAMIVGLVLVGLVAQGFNLFHYPAFTFLDDEGIYVSQAWAILREGRITHYTYVYDHAPAGWVLLSGWFGLTGGVQTLGTAINSGRVLMLLLHLGMIPLLYHLARKLNATMTTASIAALVFSLSPLALFYQRIVLLDTIMLFWALLSLNLLLDGWGRLSRLTLSGVCFGLALLSKESAIVLLPAFLFIAIRQRRRHHGLFGVTMWVVIAIAVVSWYPLYAALKGELLPVNGAACAGVNSQVTAGGVSLYDQVVCQITQPGAGILNLHNQALDLLRTNWLAHDPVLVIVGALAVFANLIRGIGWRRIRNSRAFTAGLLGILPIAYLAAGGSVLGHYVLTAIPFLCLNFAVLLGPVFARIPAPGSGVLATLMIGSLVGGYLFAGTLQPLFTAKPDAPGHDAVAWIKTFVPADSRMIIRDDIWTDLHEQGLGGPAFPNAQSYFKVTADPAIRDGVFGNDWRNVDYLVITPDTVKDFNAAPRNTLALDALAHAHRVMRWTNHDQRNWHPEQDMEVWKVDKAGLTETALLGQSAAALQARFERNGVYTGADGAVTSEAQAYAMLRAVWLGDRTEFDRVSNWTQAHLAQPDGLLAWQWRDGGVRDMNAATDADTDYALALLLGSKQWNDTAMRDVGTRTVQAIWNHEVAVVNGKPYITAGNWAPQDAVIALNPSYFAPYAYHIFHEVDPTHDWVAAIDTSYRVLFDASNSTLGSSVSAGLPPDWVGLNRETGQLVPLQLDSTDTTRYGYDAARTYWRVALDERWSNDGRAKAYLQQAGFLRDEVTHALPNNAGNKGYVDAIYTHDGNVVQLTPSMVSTAGAVAALMTLDPAAAHELFAGQVLAGVHHDNTGTYWGMPSEIYTQEWGWFVTAFYANATPDLWHNPPAR